MPTLLLDPKDRTLRTYYTKEEVMNLVRQVIDKAEDLSSEDLYVAAKNVLYDSHIELEGGSIRWILK